MNLIGFKQSWRHLRWNIKGTVCLVPAQTKWRRMHWPCRIMRTRQGYSDLNCPLVKQTVKVISIRLQFSGGSRPWDKGGGGRVSSRPWDKGGGSVSKKFFWPFGPQFGLKIRGGWPPGPLLWIHHCSCVSIINYWDQLCGLRPNFVPTQSYCLHFCLAKQWAVVVISHVEHNVLVVVTVVVFQLLHSFAHMGNKLNILYHLPYSSHYFTQKKK